MLSSVTGNVLVQLLQSHPIRMGLPYIAGSGPEMGKRVSRFIESLLPETIKEEAIVVDSSRWPHTMNAIRCIRRTFRGLRDFPASTIPSE